jgi:hypothetical protein
LSNENKLGYISNFNNKRNPDLLIPGGALKGNLYFKQDELVEAGTITDPVDLSPLSDESDSGIDDYKKLKSQISRYYADDNPTIKCRNCKLFGHIAAECPNDRKRMNCILCGNDSHDSFECTGKLCFKCNKVGHKATECESQDIDMCSLCGMTGHPS